MRHWARSAIAAVGATASIVAAAVVVAVLGAGAIAFDGWPGGPSDPTDRAAIAGAPGATAAVPGAVDAGGTQADAPASDAATVAATPAAVTRPEPVTRLGALPRVTVPAGDGTGGPATAEATSTTADGGSPAAPVATDETPEIAVPVRDAGAAVSALAQEAGRPEVAEATDEVMRVGMDVLSRVPPPGSTP